MPAPGPRTLRRYPEPLRHRLEVATAMAWEALVSCHTAEALEIVTLLAERLPFDEVVERYVREMDLPPQLLAAVRTQVLVAIQEQERRTLLSRPGEMEFSPDDGDSAPWRRFLPDAVMRGLQRRYRRGEETERWLDLAFARAEEAVIHTHIDNAVAFAALLEPHSGLRHSIDEYLRSLGVFGGRAQTIFQRSMACLADVRLPRPTGTAALGILPPARSTPT